MLPPLPDSSVFQLTTEEEFELRKVETIAQQASREELVKTLVESHRLLMSRQKWINHLVLAAINPTQKKELC